MESISRPNLRFAILLGQHNVSHNTGLHSAPLLHPPCIHSVYWCVLAHRYKMNTVAVGWLAGGLDAECVSAIQTDASFAHGTRFR